jgi:cellulose biosynthesis protein BcsQ
MGEIVTFYSYKGGTGRTMALANIGHILAWQLPPARKVLMIDWDLEAPGLHKFFFEQLKINFSNLNFALYSSTLDQAPGLIDYLDKTKSFYEGRHPDTPLGITRAETNDARTAFIDALSLHPLADYTLTINPPPGLTSGDTTSGLFLMKAGNQASSHYTTLVRTFDWETFYERYGSFFTHFREYLAAEYDLVLIDSRTGLTDIGDICTRVMPEKLVGVFVPNEQNIEGLMHVMRGAAEHRLASRDPRGLIMFPLASRIDPARSFLRNAWWKGGVVRDHNVIGYEPRFEALFQSIYRLESCNLDGFFDSTQLPHDSDYAFGEEVAARDNLSGRLTISYACTSLARYLIEDSVPWEELSSESRQTAPSLAAPARETLRELTRYLWSALVAFAGFMIVLLGPLSERNLFDSGAKDLPKIGNVVGTASSIDIAGFGAGKATLAFTSRSSGPGGREAVVLKLSRGVITPTELLLSTVQPAAAIVTSEGLGTADLDVELINLSLTQKSSTSGKVVFTYRWPVALTATAIGGALIGVAIQGMLIARSGFRSPLLWIRLLLTTVAILTSMAIVLAYCGLVSPLITPAYRYHWALILLLASTGPAILYWALRKILALVPAILVSKS